MDQYNSIPMENDDSMNDESGFSSTGTSRLAQQLRAMGHFRAPDYTFSIVQARLALESEQWQLRQEAAKTVGTLGDKAPRQLIDAILHDEQTEVRLAFFSVMKNQTRSTTMQQAAIFALRKDKQAVVRCAAAHALSMQGDIVALKALEAALVDSDAAVCAAASQALAILKERTGIKEKPVNKSYSILSQATVIAENALKQWRQNHGEEASAESTHYSSSLQATGLPDAEMQLGPYKLIKRLGSGGFAEVYLGKHIYLGTEAAVKVLHTSLLHNQTDQFIAEACTIAKLNHPHIVRVLDFNVTGNTPFLVMEYAPNGTLRQRYTKGSILPLQVIATYLSQIAHALQYAHNNDIIHCDIKPENILLGPNEEALLGDFGIAITASNQDAHTSHKIMGTVPYMAPEQIVGYPCSASDQYSMAIVAYEWLCGRTPFIGSRREIALQHISAQPPALQHYLPELPSTIEHVIMKALAKDPEQRYPDILTFANALEHAIQQSTVLVTQTVAHSRTPSSSHSTHQNQGMNAKCGSHRTARIRSYVQKGMVFFMVSVLLLGAVLSIAFLFSYLIIVAIAPEHIPLVQNCSFFVITGCENFTLLGLIQFFISHVPT